MVKEKDAILLTINALIQKGKLILFFKMNILIRLTLLEELMQVVQVVGKVEPIIL